jgi:hypothetical protein
MQYCLNAQNPIGQLPPDFLAASQPISDTWYHILALVQWWVTNGPLTSRSNKLYETKTLRKTSTSSQQYITSAKGHCNIIFFINSRQQKGRRDEITFSTFTTKPNIILTPDLTYTHLVFIILDNRSFNIVI